MRFEKGRADRTRQSVLEVASRLFRTRGFARVGVSDLMRELGMTHGGFYLHFASKAALAAEVCSRTLMQEAEAWNAGFSAEKGLENIVNICLSKEHCASPASGCLATALAADVGREPELVKEAFTEGLRALIGAFANQISEEAEVDRQERALAVLSEIVGAVALARAVSDPELASQILSSAKMHLLGPIGIKGEAKNRISREEGASFATDGRKP